MKTETIQCRDLMVGDWIADNNGFQWQIIGVGDDYAYATFDGNEGDPWEFDDKDDQPVPIPITPEILEKNGWVVHNRAMDSFFTKDENDIHIEWKYRVLSIWLCYSLLEDGTPSDLAAPVKHVHEMQHALRLCGLKELADNFKV